MDRTLFALVLCAAAGGAMAVVTSSSSLQGGSGGPGPGARGGPPGTPPDPLLEAPEGYMAFVEAPNAEPPKVGPPPYVFVDVPCPGLAGPSASKKSLNNLCGDLNKGVIPRNPMRPTPNGNPYPFELIKNKTLEFFSKALPILQADESLPKVAKSTESAYYTGPSSNRVARSVPEEAPEAAPEAVQGRSSSRQGRKFCDNGGGVMCMLYKAIQGEPLGALNALGLTGGSSLRQGGPPSAGPGGVGVGPERREDGAPHGAGPWGHGGPPGPGPQGPPGPQQGAPLREQLGPGPGPGPHMGYEGPPPTPCPARVEYSTPVFARNYQGVWRYVVQIPYEGYFTQTVEVTRCLQNKCHYMDGACLSSPRWLSMLVAELYYPDAVLPGRDQRDHPHRDSDHQNSPQYLHKRSIREASMVAGNSTGRASGAAQVGARRQHALRRRRRDRLLPGRSGSALPVPVLVPARVRLYYDWFLVPGSCKCWRPEYFSRFVRRKQPSADL
ncbi:Collagen alpha-6(VI) chain [Frankliniella fusca]|uniref:Collagen alpha-6(VI) chain n=1 Tax=Frankliniella fusca TaxID=407009 RepID=A0AAE1H7J7_9NEOP|nr:Collagen alpha-6(VI) chain [Frankliniella fusca]